MEMNESTDLKKQFPVYNRLLHITICTTLALFGLLNLVGYSQMNSVQLKFDVNQCAKNICSAAQDFDFSHQTTMYIHYPFFQTSYFVYAKGLAFSDILKTNSYLTDNFECYPVNTYKKYFDVLGTLGIGQNIDDPFMSKVAELASKNGPNNEISPCGLKAALYSRAGNTTITYENGTQLTNDIMDTEHVVDQRYIDAAKSSPNDYLNVKSGSFLSWYLPQIPGFGTKIALAVFPKGLKGKFKITFDYNNVFYDKNDIAHYHFEERKQGVTRHFSNLVYGVIMLSLGISHLVLLATYIFLEKHRSKGN